MDYIGSKIKLNIWLFKHISKVVPPGAILLDACCGSCSVSRHAASLGYSVIANDMMKFPSIIANGSIGVTESQQKSANEIIEQINSSEGIEGYFYRHFSDKSVPARLYFTSENAKKIDLTRQAIETINDEKVRDYLLYCSLEAISRVSNTTGVQAAFLKKFKDRAKSQFLLKPEPITSGSITPYHSDILSLLKDKKFRRRFKEDALYIDPPYNQRQYGPNYHLYETFVCNDNPKPSGMTGLRDWKNESRSDFCTKKKCLNFLKSIVQSTTASVVFISYNSDGLLSRDEIMSAFEKIKVYPQEQRRYKADISKDRKYNTSDLFEYLFKIETH